MFKSIVLASLALSALAFTGCDKGRAQMGNEETNILGIVKVEENSYAPSKPTTFEVSSDELYAREDFSGKKTTLLWGLITLKDY